MQDCFFWGGIFIYKNYQNHQNHKYEYHDINLATGFGFSSGRGGEIGEDEGETTITPNAGVASSTPPMAQTNKTGLGEEWDKLSPENEVLRRTKYLYQKTPKNVDLEGDLKVAKEWEAEKLRREYLASEEAVREFTSIKNPGMRDILFGDPRPFSQTFSTNQYIQGGDVNGASKYDSDGFLGRSAYESIDEYSRRMSEHTQENRRRWCIFCNLQNLFK